MHECNAHFRVLSISSITSWNVTGEKGPAAGREKSAGRRGRRQEGEERREKGAVGGREKTRLEGEEE
jgi:hypothetical protein